ncbi:DUF4199 domain-containing protein [Winogradskyella bathintestinalis]|uniref:DUF4199 domain-containing protein n=1 Tax=Winogradskyella bathintestinalis TaxID=3035208 RepID=A0ABT7ZTG2_9FLAO|nr:DUF4199 domain-containing protein [Winogradskyella bathintestinalis]MDN3492305.1 DUF4199 domain-containing protein [Winogradskyella bathintestinalis]
MEKTLKSSATTYGIYLALILSSLTIIGYAAYLDLFTKWWFGISQMILVIIFGIVSAVQARKLLEGFISFKNAFTAFFITIAIGIVIPALIGLIIFNFIDPDAATLLQEKIINTQLTMMQNFGAPQSAIDEAMKQAEAQGSFFTISNSLKSMAYQLVGFSIVGLIVAAVVKRNDPHIA